LNDEKVKNAYLGKKADVESHSAYFFHEQMLIGLGLAESTPGPLIMVTQYAGFCSAKTTRGLE
jgi:chromate transporter